MAEDWEAEHGGHEPHEVDLGCLASFREYVRRIEQRTDPGDIASRDELHADFRNKMEQFGINPKDESVKRAWYLAHAGFMMIVHEIGDPDLLEAIERWTMLPFWHETKEAAVSP